MAERAASPAGDPTRRSELAAIHIAAKDLALEEESYRSLVARFSAGRTESAGEMSTSERRALLDHFRHLGFQRKPGPKPARRRDPRPQAGKLRALWISLWQLGVVRHPDDEALAGFLKRHTGLDALQFADPEELNVAIECLREWCKRVGYVPAAFTAPMKTPQAGSFKPALIAAQWERLAQLGAFPHGTADLGKWLLRLGYGVAAPQFLEHAMADEVILTLGKWLRRLAKPEGETK